MTTIYIWNVDVWCEEKDFTEYLKTHGPSYESIEIIEGLNKQELKILVLQHFNVGV